MPTPLSAESRKQLIQAAIHAKSNAYAPYSNFHVGAAVLCDDGTVIDGCNVENASNGGTICAERTAIVKAVSQGKRKLAAIAVTSNLASHISPCGICRQSLCEFFSDDALVLLVPGAYDPADGDPKGDRDVREETVGGLMPLSFGPGDWNKPKVP